MTATICHSHDDLHDALRWHLCDAPLDLRGARLMLDAVERCHRDLDGPDAVAALQHLLAIAAHLDQFAFYHGVAFAFAEAFFNRGLTERAAKTLDERAGTAIQSIRISVIARKQSLPRDIQALEWRAAHPDAPEGAEDDDS